MSSAASPTDRLRRAPVRLEDWGRLGYEKALARQLELAESRARGEAPDTIVSVEHPPTVTLGRHAPAADIIVDERELARRRIALVRTDRGGRATYHGPGQAVIYPIVGIDDLRLGTKDWVALLEDCLLATLAGYGIEATRREGNPGLWVGDAKIGSLGLRVSRGVSYHGVSLNVGLDVSGFDCIVTCGVAGQNVTSIAAHSASTPDVREACSRISQAIRDRIS